MFYFQKIEFIRVYPDVPFQLTQYIIFNGMSRVSVYQRNIHISIFRFLINFDAQFPVNVKLFPFEYIYRFIKCNMVCATPFIYKNIFPQVVKFINPSRKLFFVAFNDSESVIDESFKHFRPYDVFTHTYNI